MANDTRLAYQRLHTRRVVSLVGSLRVRRAGCGAPGRDSIQPLDAELHPPGRSYSHAYQRHLVRSAICGPFDEADRFLVEMTGAQILKRSAEHIVAEAAADFDSLCSARAGKGDLAPDDIMGPSTLQGRPAQGQSQ